MNGSFRLLTGIGVTCGDELPIFDRVNLDVTWRFNMKKLQERIKWVREQIGWNQSDFARQLGLTRAAVNRMESGEASHLRAETVLKMERLTVYSADWLVFGDGGTREAPVV
ncbi:MAG: DNA-binding XRE family transcriptional regulator [Alcanivorax sp.]